MSSGITVSPAFQEVTLSATQSSTVVSVLLINTSDEEVSVTPQLGELERQDPERPSAEFIPRQVFAELPYATLSSKELKISPKASANIQISVNNTSLLSPGGHYFSLVMPLRVGTDQKLNPTVTSAVFLTKQEGAEYRLELLSAHTPKLQVGSPELQLRFQNTGNTHAVPYGKVTAYDIFDREVFTSIINTDSKRVFPEQEYTVPVQLERSTYAFPVSLYRLQVEGRVLPGDALYQATAQTVVIQPLQCIGLLVISLVVIRIFFVNIRRASSRLRFIKLMLVACVCAALSISGAVFPSAAYAYFPESGSYSLHDFGMGGGGDTENTSTNYGLNALLGELSDTQLQGTTYSLGPGVIFTRQANVPAAPTFTNPSSYYDKLHIIIDDGDNPSDATFAIAISSDNFVTTQYVQSDMTVGSVLDITDYQTYAGWGGVSGATIIGLVPNTTYEVKVKAMHGDFTETGYSATATASTVLPSLTYDLDVSATDSESAPPYALAFGQLTPASVTTAADKIWVDLATNGNSGAVVAIRGDQVGLYSPSSNTTITSATADLAVAAEGFGVQVATVAEAGGGPLAAVSPYNGASQNVGVVDLSYRAILESAAPLTAGRASIFVKTKASAVTAAANDYADTLTVVAAGKF